MAPLFSLPCSEFPVRDGPVSPFEYTAAELYMQAACTWSFYQRHANPSLAIALAAGPRFVDSSYFAHLFRVTDRSLSLPIQICLKYLLADFRNPLPQTRMKQLERAYKNGELTWELMRDFIDLIKRPGGMRKPDFLGIVTEQDPGQFELHEVCTVKTMSGTVQESDSKLDQLRKQVIPNVIKELATQQSEMRATTSPLIHRFEAIPSNWAPPRELRACPLGVSFDGQRNTTKVTWACFEPAVDPFEGPDGRQKLVTPGILPYHIHEIDGPRINVLLPPAVRADLKRWEGQLARSRGLAPLELLPEANPVIRQELQGFTPEGRLILATAALGVTVVVFAIIAGPIIADVLAGAAALDFTAMSVASAATRIRAAVPTIRTLYSLAADYSLSLSRVARTAPAY